mgnify:CR=1 FL=1
MPTGAISKWTRFTIYPNWPLKHGWLSVTVPENEISDFEFIKEAMLAVMLGHTNH